MKKLIVSFSGLIAMAFVTLILFGAQMALHQHIKGDGAKIVVNATCVAQEAIVVDGRNDEVALKLDCQGQKAVLRDSKVVVNYLNNPGLLTCTVYKSGKAKCQSRE